MGWLDKLFGRESSSVSVPAQPAIRFGRYSDNNKRQAKTQLWYVAEEHHKAGRANECLRNFFDYLRDEEEDNVELHPVPGGYTFTVYQGSTVVHGEISGIDISARVALARMEKPSVPVMRRLLEMNYALYYSRFALDGDRLCMLFDTPRDSASPNKLYYGLKELATKADKQDDLLLTDFGSLQALEGSPARPFDENERTVKYRWYTYWIDETLERVDSLNQDSFSGGIAYLLLSLLYRIDFLITPEGKLLNELERLNEEYWSAQEERTAVERNQKLREELRKLRAWPEEEVTRYFYRARATFAITQPKPFAEVALSLRTARENMTWFRENKYETIALRLLEYGLTFPQYSFSLPKPLTELILLYMQIQWPEFFRELGFDIPYRSGDTLQPASIRNRISQILAGMRDKYPNLSVDADRLNYGNLTDFNLSLIAAMESFNFDNTPTP